MATKSSMLVVVVLLISAAMFAASWMRARAQVSDNEPQPVARLIVKPLQPVSGGQALLAAIRNKLPTEQRVSFLRDMSGGAYVLSVIAPATQDDVPAIVTQLLATGLFEYVEVDRRMSIH